MMCKWFQAFAVFALVWCTDAVEEDRANDTAEATIPFGPLPPQSEVASQTVHMPGALSGYYEMPRSFIDTVRPGPLPYETVMPVLSTLACALIDCENDVASGSGELAGVMSADGDEDSLALEGARDGRSIIMQFVRWQIPVLVMVGLGLLMAILFPCVGCFFCCCRLCGLCGAKAHRYKKNHQTAKCIVWTFIFLTADSMILTGVIFGFLSNEKISESIENFGNTASKALHDGINYLNDTVNELDSIATDDLNQVTSRIIYDLENIESMLGDPLETALQQQATPVFDSAMKVLDMLTRILESISNINTTVEALFELQEDMLAPAVLQLSNDLQNLSMTCSIPQGCELIPSSSTIDIEADWSDADDLTSTVNDLEEIDVPLLNSSLRNASQSVDDISTTLSEEVENLDIASTISEAEDEIEEVMGGVREAISNATAEDGTLNDVEEYLSLALGSDGFAGIFDTYRYAAASVLLTLIAFIIVVYSIGVFCGVFGYSARALPYERSSVSHCGAKLLLLAVGLCFLISGLLLLLSSFIFSLATMLQKICNDVDPVRYVVFREIVDNPLLWDGNTLIGAATEVAIEHSLNLSITGFLNDCESNKSLWEALQADSLLDEELNDLLSSVTEVLDELSAMEDFQSSVDLSSDDVFPSENRDRLEDISSILDGVNISNFQRLLDLREISFDLEEVEMNLTLVANASQAAGQNDTYNLTLAIIESLDGINSTLQEISQQTELLQMNITQLEMDLENITSSVLEVLNRTDVFVNRSTDIIAQAVGDYFDTQLDYVTDYISHVNYSVRHEVGRCRAVPAIYKALFVTVCKDMVDGLNGFWFSLGWCVLGFIPAIVAGVVLTVYFRRSPSDIHELSSEDFELYESEMYTNTPVVGATYTRNHHSGQMSHTSLPHVPIVDDW